MILQGIRNSIERKPYIFVIFQGGGGDPDPLSPLDPPMRIKSDKQNKEVLEGLIIMHIYSEEKV